MIPKLVELLIALGYQPSDEQMADLLWLFAKLPRATVNEPSAQHIPSEPLEVEPPHADLPRSSLAEHPTPSPVSHADTSGTDLYPKTGQREGEGYGKSGIKQGVGTIKIPDAPALPGAIQLARAFKPLTKKVRSRTHFTLNENATADRLAVDELLVPVLEPARVRRFTLDIVVDTSTSMLIWRDTILELRKLLLRLGAFQDVRTWSLDTEHADDVRITKGMVWQKPFTTKRSPKELIDPTGQRLILVVSDCVSHGWRTGKVTSFLSVWGQTNSVAIVQVLPEYMWKDTALGYETPIRIGRNGLSTVNRHLMTHFNDSFLDTELQGIGVPVVTLAADEIKAWAAFVTGGVVSTPQSGYWFIPPESDEEDIEVSFAPVSSNTDSSDESISRVLDRMSPPARDLLYALATVPLTLPLIRLVQRVVVPKARQEHIAEVLLGGLIRHEISSTNPNEILYEFVSDEIRQRIIDDSEVVQTRDVFKLVSRYIEERIESRRTIPAKVGVQDSEITTDIDVSTNRRFARVKNLLLRSLGLESAVESGRFRITESTDARTQSVNDASSLATTTVLLNEVKVLVVGEVNVGKTSLIKTLLGGKVEIDRREPTLGIVRRDLIMPVGGRDITLHLWDFGTQEIMHSTHRLFLTTGSFYLLVLDATQDESSNRVVEWLKTIHLYSPDSPVILVINKLDLYKLRLNISALEQHHPIATVIETSCVTQEGIKNLHSSIQRELQNLRHLNNEIPVSWMTVRRRVSELNKDYLQYDEFASICRGNEVSDKDYASVEALLHSLGVLSSNKEELIGKYIHVLNPNWLTGGIHQILNNTAIKISNGFITNDDIARHLSQLKYPIETHILFLETLVTLEMAFRLERNFYLIPELLSKERPLQTTWDESQCVKFIYQYDLLPPKLFSRFISVTKDEIDPRMTWYSGIMLRQRKKLYAQILLNTDAKTIEISVIATDRKVDNRRALLDDIRGRFKSLHKGYLGIVVQEFVPIRDTDVLIPYADLLFWEEHRELKQYHHKIGEFDVKELLNGSPIRTGLGRLSLAQRKDLQVILVNTGLIDTYRRRVNFCENAGLDILIDRLPMLGDTNTFAGDLVRECERLGAPPAYKEYTTALLITSLRDELFENSFINSFMIETLTEMLAVYVPDHATKYPLSKETDLRVASLSSRLLEPPIKIAAFFTTPLNVQELPNLNREEQKVRDLLSRKSDFDLITVRQTRLRDLLALLDRRNHRLSLFHYSGHASEEGIWLEAEEGNESEIIPWGGLAIELSHQPDLVCIVLNGCKTAINDFLSYFGANRPIIIAMSEQIGDQKATYFSTRFYESLAAKDSIQTAFEKACNYLLLKGYRDREAFPRLV